MSKLIDLSGRKFTNLEVICYIGKQQWYCLCDCGGYSTPASSSLRLGITKSCGCIAAQIASSRSATHRMSKSKLYWVWGSMIDRCCNDFVLGYHRYGGRGITVCDEWRNSFESFCEWSTNNGYKHGLSIDRIDNDGGYSPENCRWVTMIEQNRNRSNNKLTAESVALIKRYLKNESMLKSEIADLFCVSRSTISDLVAGRTWANIKAAEL